MDMNTNKVKQAVSSTTTAVKDVAKNVTDEVKAGVKRATTPMRLDALRDVTRERPITFRDVRGWKVELSDGATIGSVARILVEDVSKQLVPRYLDVHLKASANGVAGRKAVNVLIPIGRAQLVHDAESVRLPTLTTPMLGALPRLAEGAITWEHELEVAKAFNAVQAFDSPDALYRTDLFNVNHFQAGATVTR